MSIKVALVMTVACLLVWISPSWAKGIETYSWKDGAGVVHYSNLLTQQAISRGYVILNGEGDIIKRVPAPLTPRQRAKEEAEARRLARDRAARAERARRDQALLRSFTSVEDIARLRDERVSALDARLRLLQSRQSQMEARLHQLEATASRDQAAKRRVPASVEVQIRELKSGLQEVDSAIGQLQSDRAATLRRFDAYIARFKKLQSRQQDR